MPFLLQTVGSIDPWHALSVLSSLSATETAIYINGTAHCADEQSTSSRTPPAILKAKLVRITHNNAKAGLYQK